MRVSDRIARYGHVTLICVTQKSARYVNDPSRADLSECINIVTRREQSSIIENGIVSFCFLDASAGALIVYSILRSTLTPSVFQIAESDFRDVAARGFNPFVRPLIFTVIGTLLLAISETILVRRTSFVRCFTFDR